ncbi:MAG: hypothetical protein IT165_25030 [Bryobacterales bacterium]|nr:hypothetical protein [Bryobacterales bacterium]
MKSKLVCLVLLSAPFAAAQWTPYTADLTIREYEVKQDGSRVLLREFTGTAMRGRDGSTLEVRNIRIDSTKSCPPHTGTLLDAASRTVYSLNYAIGEATIVQRLRSIPRMKPDAQFEKGYSNVNGVQCLVVDRQLATNRSTSCVLPELSIFVRSEMEGSMSNGTRFLSIEELSNLRIGTEPPSGAFQLPQGFRVMERARAK